MLAFTRSNFQPQTKFGKNSFVPKRQIVNVTRNQNFKRIGAEDVKFFEKVLGKAAVVTDKDELEPLNNDWLKKYKGSSPLALFPSTTEQVSDILKYCNQQRLAVVPQGGNTGLVGGGVPVFDEIILSLSKMTNVISFDDVSGVVVCEAGIILSQLDSYLEKFSYTVPLDLGAKGSCQIGGNVSTNAGGLRLLRYGSLHGSVLGLEVVLADGRIMKNLNILRKDNTGYDLKQLFIGSEGSLGIITKVSLACPVKPKAVRVAFLGCQSMDKVREIFVRTKLGLNEILSAFEFMDRHSFELVLKHKKDTSRDPFDTQYPFYVLIETSGSDDAHDYEKLSNFLSDIISEQMIEKWNHLSR
eukprot:TRINITY_DN10888_c0_g1_i1.p1 TRINITY_DN10888_c0_g1~~TRINITY_DN10888_c0_g1_i1.p1  ORF type:complete len:356 (+),score=78.91 TRINITY_DN10888_c0_g1_i1:141-1208(+)